MPVNCNSLYCSASSGQRQTRDRGKKHDYASIRTYEDFKKRLPIQTYEEVKPYVTRLRAGEQNLFGLRKYVGLPNHRVPPTTRVSSCPSAGSPCTTRITREAGMPLPSIWDRIPKVVSFPVKGLSLEAATLPT